MNSLPPMDTNKPFDPFTATAEEAQAQPDAYAVQGAVLRWGAAQIINTQRAQMEANPIDGIAQCVAAKLSVPDWLATAFLAQYWLAKHGTVRTWDKAFGPANPKREHLPTLRFKLENQWAYHYLQATPAAREEVAKALGLTAKQKRALLPASRKNGRGHKSYKTQTSMARGANDPFGIAPEKVPKK